MIDDIRSTLPPGIKAIMDSAEAYWQQRTGLRSEEVHELILWIERQAIELVRTRNIVDAQDSAEDTPTLVEREVKALSTEADRLKAGLRKAADRMQGWRERGGGPAFKESQRMVRSEMDFWIADILKELEAAR